ncbi:MAG TPA: hypothetical protein VGI18_01900 [Burkholderiales bacterium]
MKKRSVLILGASYGSLLATKLAMAGHAVSLVCTRPTADLINRDGTVVRFPLRGRDPVEISSNLLPGDVTARCPEHTDPAEYDLIVLGMQEAQYGADGVRELMRHIARSRKPCLAIMNMPPLPYLKRIAGLDTAALAGCYADASVWEGFDPARITLASPDAQAFRPAGHAKNVLHVGLPTNFKAARFESEEHTELLRELEADIESARLGDLEIPVKLKVHDSLFVPLAKWPMLIAGNYRCIRADGMVPIRDAVHEDVTRSREVYEWVAGLCHKLGAQAADLVPFEKYAQAADGLGKPSSAARALFAGALHIDRVDRLVRRIARQIGLQCDAALHEIVALVDERLARNRLSADPLRRAA